MVTEELGLVSDGVSPKARPTAATLASDVEHSAHVGRRGSSYGRSRLTASWTSAVRQKLRGGRLNEAGQVRQVQLGQRDRVPRREIDPKVTGRRIRERERR